MVGGPSLGMLFWVLVEPFHQNFVIIFNIVKNGFFYLNNGFHMLIYIYISLIYIYLYQINFKNKIKLNEIHIIYKYILYFFFYSQYFSVFLYVMYSCPPFNDVEIVTMKIYLALYLGLFSFFIFFIFCSLPNYFNFYKNLLCFLKIFIIFLRVIVFGLMLSFIIFLIYNVIDRSIFDSDVAVQARIRMYCSLEKQYEYTSINNLTMEFYPYDVPQKYLNFLYDCHRERSIRLANQNKLADEIAKTNEYIKWYYPVVLSPVVICTTGITLFAVALVFSRITGL